MSPIESGQRVVVADIHMSFGSMVAFMVKAAIASIPALLILTVLGFLVAGASATFFGLILPQG